jgi:hypothetical protein
VLVEQDRCRLAISHTILRKKPTKAAQNKWSKLVPSYTFFTFGSVVHDILSSLCNLGMRRLTTVYEHLAAAHAAGGGENVGEMNFHSISGARLRRLLNLVDNQDISFVMKIIGVVFEASRTFSMGSKSDNFWILSRPRHACTMSPVLLTWFQILTYPMLRNGSSSLLEVPGDVRPGSGG